MNWTDTIGNVQFTIQNWTDTIGNVQFTIQNWTDTIGNVQFTIQNWTDAIGSVQFTIQNWTAEIKKEYILYRGVFFYALYSFLTNENIEVVYFFNSFSSASSFPSSHVLSCA